MPGFPLSLRKKKAKKIVIMSGVLLKFAELQKDHENLFKSARKNCTPRKRFTNNIARQFTKKNPKISPHIPPLWAVRQMA